MHLFVVHPMIFFVRVIYRLDRPMYLHLYCSVGAGSARPYILRQSLTFMFLSFIYFQVFLSQLFDRKKLQKLPAHGLSKSLKALARELPCNITHPPFSCRLCLPFQSREQKNSLHALPSSYGTHAQTLLFLFLNWN